ncbi:MAG: RsmB/NOP family class I SAM-dependent RNA methyltransferase, partial [Paracoccaceae bacterium]
AMAGRVAARFFAHDALPQRMRDLPARAKRAGVDVTLLDRPETQAPYDLVLCDVPCSGSGAWRRSPEGKWSLTEGGLDELVATQAQILDRAATLVGPGGVLAYATCSMLQAENGAQIAGFMSRHSGWRVSGERRFTPLDGGDGFYSASLLRTS